MDAEIQADSDGVKLEKWKRNLVFQAIKAVGLDPGEVEWDGEDGQSPLRHSSSESYFIFDGDARRYVGSYRVGKELQPWPYEFYTWPSLMQRVEGWLREVKSDLETPDLWAELRREREMLGGVPDEAVQNTPFTQEEQAEIAKQLREIKEYAKKTYSLSEAQRMLLEARLDYLQEAASRLRRIDWRNALVGAIFGYIFAAALPPEAARDIFKVALGALAHLFAHPIPELPSG